jgi:hypothetical protein
VIYACSVLDHATKVFYCWQRSKQGIGEFCTVSLDRNAASVNSASSVSHAFNIRNHFHGRYSSHRDVPTNDPQPNNVSSIPSTMFKRFKRKLSTAARKRRRRDKVFNARSESSSGGSPTPDPWRRILPKERGSPPQPGIGACPDERVKKLANSGNVSRSKLGRDDRTTLGAAIHPPTGPKDEEIDKLRGTGRAQSNSHQQESKHSLIWDESVKFITLQTPSQNSQALLLSPCKFQRT